MFKKATSNRQFCFLEVVISGQRISHELVPFFASYDGLHIACSIYICNGRSREQSRRMHRDEAHYSSTISRQADARLNVRRLGIHLYIATVYIIALALHFICAGLLRKNVLAI